MHSQRHRTDDRGFSLIELVIVILVLAVLAGLTTYAVFTFQNDATAACTKSNSRTNASASAANEASPGGSYTATGGTC